MMMVVDEGVGVWCGVMGPPELHLLIHMFGDNNVETESRYEHRLLYTKEFRGLYRFLPGVQEMQM